jgi:Cu2+-exporting ATPase
VFDKTGTLTEPVLALDLAGIDASDLSAAASLAANSRHPLARALVAAAGPVVAANGVTEHPGEGLAAFGGATRLGSRAFCGVAADEVSATPALWFTRPGRQAIRFAFTQRLRPDAAQTVARLRSMGLSIHLLSGDHRSAVAPIAEALGIESWHASCSPIVKTAMIEALTRNTHRTLMVGDGLNDSPSLAAAHVSASPASAADISQTVADAVFQGENLAPVALLVGTARRARAVMRQNLVLAIGYNVLMVPLAVAGWVTPWLAAAAMSSSSLLVMANSFRLHKGLKSIGVK